MLPTIRLCFPSKAGTAFSLTQEENEMCKLTPKAMAALLAAVTLTTSSSFTIAQDKSQLPQIFVDQPALELRTIRPVQKRVERLRDMILLNDKNSIKAVTKIELGKFWIGLNCANVSPALRSQLKLKKGVGLLVVNAFEGSPSRKAGLKQHDIIVKAGGKDIGAVGQLIQAVQKAGEAEIKLDIVREGQPKSITVKSAKRPSEQQVNSIYLPQTGGEHQLLFRTPNGAFTLIEPGVVVAPNHSWTQTRTIKRQGQLPAGVSVTVTRKSGSEVTIHVEQNEQKWDITPNEIDQLPKVLQPHVKAMLAPPQTQLYTAQHSLPLTRWLQSKLIDRKVEQREEIIKLPAFTPLGNHLTNKKPESGGNAKPVESEIEKLKRELSQEMKQLRKAVEELKKSNEEK
jgi:hypothetical protein